MVVQPVPLSKRQIVNGVAFDRVPQIEIRPGAFKTRIIDIQKLLDTAL